VARVIPVPQGRHPGLTLGCRLGSIRVPGALLDARPTDCAPLPEDLSEDVTTMTALIVRNVNRAGDIHCPGAPLSPS